MARPASHRICATDSPVGPQTRAARQSTRRTATAPWAYTRRTSQSAWPALHPQDSSGRMRTGGLAVKIGIVSDIHCDVVAFERALEEMGPVDLLMGAGDWVLQDRKSTRLNSSHT